MRICVLVCVHVCVCKHVPKRKAKQGRAGYFTSEFLRWQREAQEMSSAQDRVWSQL